MRALFWVLFLAAAAVGIVLAARYNAGYVLLVLHPYRIEVSLSFLVALLLIGFVAFYILLRIATHALRLPNQVRQFRERRRLRRARESLLNALRVFLEGRYAKAEKAAAESIDLTEHSGLAAVIAARSAHELRAYDRRDRYLSRAAYYRDEDAVVRAVTQAELALAGRQFQDALSALERLPQKHTAALRLELRAQQQARNWDRYVEVLVQLERAHALDEAQALELRRLAIGEVIARKSLDAGELGDYWQRLGSRERQDAKIVACAARAFAQLERCDEALSIIEQSLDRAWDSDLVAVYAHCIAADSRRQIERGEGWLRSHPTDPALLLALGQLCARQKLWGKARSYIEASLSLEDTFQAHIVLARLLDELGEKDAAQRHFQRSIVLAEEAMGERSRAALREPAVRLAAPSPA